MFLNDALCLFGAVVVIGRAGFGGGASRVMSWRGAGAGETVLICIKGPAEDRQLTGALTSAAPIPSRASSSPYESLHPRGGTAYEFFGQQTCLGPEYFSNSRPLELTSETNALLERAQRAIDEARRLREESFRLAGVARKMVFRVLVSRNQRQE
jgi:hypothetical protein